jgi:hypothetical protein
MDDASVRTSTCAMSGIKVPPWSVTVAAALVP